MAYAYICDGIRTPIGRYNGALAKIRADDLAALPLKALIARYKNLDLELIDEVILGCANQAGEDNRNVARMAALLAGLPDSVPAVTVNRLCASGLDAVGQAARSIVSGEVDLVLAGGVESMTRAPFVMGKADTAFSRYAKIEDTTIGWRFVNPEMVRTYGIHSMPETGENVATDYRIGRVDQDALGLRSQQRAAAAQARGYFTGEIAPVTVPNDKAGGAVIDRDEHPRPDTTMDGLGKLKPIVHADGTVTAGNAAGVNDGAAALIIASDVAIQRHGLTPRAKILGYATAGVAPRVMGMGPVPAVRRLMEKTGLKLKDFDVIELNEAFAAQVLAVLRQLGLPDDAKHVNSNGGAIALGHPLGATGARLALTAMRALEESKGRYALATLCIGVGQGAALAMERI
ncbi:MAG TPA: 3-oxoadipyl-CoA thiolase [Rhizomicrobium sp.]|nr:3-oxoadipyl-CoA thiolase [Rhizomicrobium sp.]